MTTALLVSATRLDSARALWDHRAVFGPGIPELHVVSEGRFLTATEALLLVPEARDGLDYQGNFFDALQAHRLSLVLPLLESTGALQGLLEFVGVPYAGCGMTSALLAADQDHSEAVLASLGLKRAQSPAAVTVAVLGNEETVVGAGTSEVQDLCRRVYRGLGLSGWALIGAAKLDGDWGWTSVEVQPDLSPGQPFLNSLAPRGLGLDAVLERLLGWGRARHDAENSLKSLFKDKI